MRVGKHPTEKVGRKPKTSSKKTGIVGRVSSFFGGLGRNTRLAMMLGALLVVAGVVAFGLTGNSNEDTVATNEETVQENDETAALGAAITLREGTLQVKDEEGVWGDVTSDTQVVAGTALRTVGATSRAVIAFDDGSAVRLDANSELEFETLTVERVEIRHVAGYTYNRVLPSDTRTYIVTSNDAQYEALGTAFRTAATGDEQAVEVYQSSVVETSINKRPQEGEKLTVINRNEPSKNEQIEKLDIEAIKTDPFIQWNRNLDEQDDSFRASLGFLSDIESPEITISSPADNSTILLDPSATEGSVQFVGSTEKDASLTVQNKSQQNSVPLNIVVDDAGNFASSVIPAPLGNSLFEFVVKDRVGNTTKSTLRVTFQRKSAPVSGSGSIVLTISSDSEDLTLSWAYGGSVNTDDGVKIVYSTDSNPSYPGDDSAYEPSDTTFTKKLSSFDSGKTYYFRVCEYDADDDECGIYSNQVEIDIP